MNNQNIIIIYNLLKGSDSRLSFQKVRYGIALLKHEEILEGLKKFDTLQEVLKFAKDRKEDILDDVDLKEIKLEVTHDLTEGMLHGYFDVDAISVDAYYHPEIEDLAEVVKLGKIIVDHPEEELEKLFPPIPISKLEF